MTVVEGAIVDIIPEEPPAGFISGQITLDPAVADTSIIIVTVQNLNGEYYLEIEPDISGISNYIMQVPIGNYTVTSAYPDYEFISYDNIIVEEFQITTVDFSLDQIIAPVGLEAVLSGNEITLNWQHNSTRMLQYFNIYRNINSTAFTLLDTTSQLNYVDTIIQPQNLTYGYYVTAKYAQDNESHSTNQVYVEYIVTVTGDEIMSSYLLGNYPNPFNPETTIYFSLAEDSSIELVIFNVKGQKVKTIAEGVYEKGKHAEAWNGEDENGKTMASGVYLYQLKAGVKTAIKRMLLLK